MKHGTRGFLASLTALAFALVAIHLFANGPQIPLGGGLGPSGPFPILAATTITLSGSSPVTLSQAQYGNTTIEFTGTTSGTIAVTVPLVLGMHFNATNATTNPITFGGATGAVVTIAVGATAIVACQDGANYIQLNTSGSGGGGGDGGCVQTLTTSSTIFVDPVAGSDSALCTSSGTACKTLAQIQAVRWCGFPPILTQATTIWNVHPVPQSDPWYLVPNVANGGSLTINGASYWVAAPLPGIAASAGTFEWNGSETPADASTPVSPIVWGGDAGGGNPYLYQANVWIDPANATDAGSDQNDCLNVATPCRTNLQMKQRQGGRDNGNSQREMLSSNVGQNDPVQWTPCLAPQTFPTIDCVMTQVGSCTISAVQNRVVGTTSGGSSKAIVTAPCITGPAQFVHDSTVDSGIGLGGANFEVEVAVDAGVWQVNQPMAPCNAAECTRQEVNNLAPGDSITVSTMPELDVDIAGSSCGDGSGYFAIQHCAFASHTGRITGTFPFIVEDEVVGGILVSNSIYPEFVNVGMYSGNVRVSPPVSGGEFLIGINHAGAWRGGKLLTESVVTNTSFDLGADIEGAIVNGDFGDVYVGPSSALVSGNSSVNANGGTFWGPGVMNMQPGSTFSYTCSAATSTFLNGAPSGYQFSFNGEGIGCSFTYVNGTATATIVCGILTAPNLQTGGIFASLQVGAWLPGYAITCFP
jgi:hypothetical protein